MVSARNAGLLLLIVCAIGGSAFSAENALRIRWRSGESVRTPINAAEAANRVVQFVPGSGVRHVVVQFTKPCSPVERARLEAAGLRLLNYLGDNAFFAAVTSQGVARGALAGVASLADVTPVLPVWKLHPLLAAGARPTWAQVDTDPQGDPVIGAYVLFHRDVPFATAGVAAVRRHGGVVRSVLRSVNGLVVELTPAQIASLAQEDVVQYVEPALPPLEGLNAENRALTGAEVVQAAPFNLDGTGVTVLVYDAGRAMTASGATHPDVNGRITLGDSAPASAHAAHVTCTVGGDGAQSAGMSRGMAPGVNLLSYGFQFDGTGIFLYTNPGDMEADYTEAITLHGADLANNSIGTNTCANGFPCSITGDYGVTSALIDNIVAGSLGAPFRVIFANGNERACGFCPLEHQNGYHSTAPPACAKNHITVGAVNANDDSITTFTSWGPADDGRLKPDISAPGCQVGGDNGVTSCNTSLGVFGYSVLCGTSMAAPTVSGLAALLLQDFRTLFPASPDFRNSMLKVLLAHNAADIGNPGPDYQSGYGSVRIVPSVDFMRSGNFVEDQVDHLQTYTVFVDVNPGDTELKVTLAWDDAAGTPNVDPALVNDLDLSVFDPSGVEHFPWTLDPANPALPAVRTQADHINNIEQVVIDAPVPGFYRVEVHGFNVPSGPQIFALAGSPQLLTPNVGTLVPVTATRSVATQHTLTATFRDSVPPFNPVPNVIVTFDVLSGPNMGVTGTGTTDVNGQAFFTYTGADLTGVDQIQASFDDMGVPRLSNIATSNWVAGTITLAPDGGTGNVRTTHTVTADVTEGASPFNPLVGELVTFEVLSGPNAGVIGTGTTDANGQASFTYTGADLAGTDSIGASFFDAGADRFSNTVTHDWLPGQITLSPTSVIVNECVAHTVIASVVLGAPPSTPISGALVTFDILAGPNAGESATDVTDAGGFAVFTYLGDAGPGTDQIQASFVDASATQLSNTVSVIWLASTSGLDCNLNGIADECEIGFDQDCNANGASDLCDLAPLLTFDPPAGHAVDANPFSIVTADFDGVNGLDLATASNANSTVSVMLNNGDGTFAVAVDYATDRASSEATVADFDRDGDLDIAVSAQNDTIELLLNDGSGIFTNGVIVATLGNRPESIAAADLDGLNGPDLVVANRNSDDVSVLLNNGNATFATAVIYTAGITPQHVAIANLDGVNGPDIIVANKQSDNVSVLLNTGTGTFATAVSYAAGTGPTSVVAVDLDGDLDLDLAITLGGANSVTTLANSGTGTFSLAGGFTVGIAPESIVARDFDGDGDADLAVANAGTLAAPGTTFSVLLNHGDGTSFEPHTEITTPSASPVSITAGDYDQDGNIDVAVCHDVAPGSVSVIPTAVTRVSLDCNGNAVPDECDPDADGDVVPDDCDLCPGTFPGSPVDAVGCPPSIACSSAGTLVLDSATYNCSDLAFIQVVDCDLDANAAVVETVDVTLASNTQPAGQIVTLTETAVDSAVFEGSNPIDTIGGAGVVQISGGDTLTATYVDADDGMGGVNVAVVDTAAVAVNCLDVTVQLESVDTPITRNVTFVLTDCVGMITETFVQAMDFDATGVGTTTLTLSNANAEWISAVEGHTLRSLLPLGIPLPTSVSFTGPDRLYAGDITGDGFVDVEDFSVLAFQWNLPGTPADFNGDGVQGTVDFTAVVVNFFLFSDPVDGCVP